MTLVTEMLGWDAMLKQARMALWFIQICLQGSCKIKYTSWLKYLFGLYLHWLILSQVV